MSTRRTTAVDVGVVAGAGEVKASNGGHVGFPGALDAASSPPDPPLIGGDDLNPRLPPNKALEWRRPALVGFHGEAVQATGRRHGGGEPKQVSIERNPDAARRGCGDAQPNRPS